MTIFDASLQNLGDYFDATPSKVVVQGDGYYVSGSYGYENGKLRMSTNYGAMVCYGFATKNKINLTGFKYIRFSGIDGNPTSSNSNAFQFDISDEKYISFMNQPPWSRLNTWDERCGTAIRDRDSSSVSQIVVDISDIAGEWYFVMGSANTVNETGTNTYISKIELLEDITPSGGAGSGYIGNTLVSNKKMVGYNVPTSSAESTKTESVNEASESPVSGKPKIGNGHAKIKLIREYPTPPSNYLVDIEAEYGAFNLVTQYPLDRSYLTGVAVQNDYFYREDLIGSTIQSGFFIPYGNKLNITGKVVFETEVLIGDEDRTATASPDFTMGFYSGFSYSTRIIEMTYRNHNFQSTSAWDYFYYYSNCPLGYPKAPMDYEEYYNSFTKIKFELVLESGVLKKLICYRDNVLYQEDDLNIDVSSIVMPYIKLSIPSANNRQPLTQKVKYFKVYTET